MDIELFFAENEFSTNTEDRYRRALARLDILGDVAGMGAVEFKCWLNNQGWGSSSRWVAFCAARRFLRWRYGESHAALRLRIRRDPSPPQRALSTERALDLLASFDTTRVKGIRDLAIAALMLDSGLRCSEICRLSLDHLDLTERRFTVLVKGGRWGEGVYSEITASFLARWLAIRTSSGGAGAVFISLGGKDRGAPLTRDGLRVVVRAWGKRIGVKLSPHDLRRTFAVLSTRAGAPARVLQVAGRWSSLEMVERYTRQIEAADFEPWFPVSRLMS